MDDLRKAIEWNPKLEKFSDVFLLISYNIICYEKERPKLKFTVQKFTIRDINLHKINGFPNIRFCHFTFLLTL